MITSDDLVVSIDTVLYFRVVDPVRATYEIANLLQAIEPPTIICDSMERGKIRLRSLGWSPAGVRVR